MALESATFFRKNRASASLISVVHVDSLTVDKLYLFVGYTEAR